MYRTEISLLPDWAILLILVLVVWSIYWKAAALWHAARHHKLNWFVALSLINTVGILEIIYLFGVEKIDTDKLFK